MNDTETLIAELRHTAHRIDEGKRADSASYLLDRAADALAARTRLEEALSDIAIRCREGDKRSDWLPIIERIAREALAAVSSDTPAALPPTQKTTK